MPSPLGHALAAVAAGCLVRGYLTRGERPVAVRNRWSSLTFARLAPMALVFGVIGLLPDLDFLVGAHSAYTHSLGAIAVVGLAVSAVGRDRSWMLGAAVAAAYGSHVLLDWLGTDDTAPHGVMALWPLSDAYYLSEVYLFSSVCRQYWLWSCWQHNMMAAARELVVLLPLAAAAVYWSRSRPRSA